MSRALAAVLLWTACDGPASPIPLGAMACEVAEQRTGERVCAHRIESFEQWDTLSEPSSQPSWLSQTQWMAPRSTEAYLQQPLFADASASLTLWQILPTAFPEAFADLVVAEDQPVRSAPALGEYAIGDIGELTHRGGPLWGFTLWQDTSDSDPVVTEPQVAHLYAQLAERVAMRPLVWIPNTTAQRDAAARWSSPSVPILHDDSPVAYDVYVEATSSGTLRVVDAHAVAQLSTPIEHSDIIVTDAAPFTVAPPVGGVITGAHQVDLSPLNLRSATHRTPSCYLHDALHQLSPWRDQLVTLTCSTRGYTLIRATADEVEHHWADRHPEPIDIVAPNSAFSDLTALTQVRTVGASDRRAAAATFGGDAMHLAAASPYIAPDMQIDGIIVPVSWHLQFMQATHWTVDLGEGPAEHSLSETLIAWQRDVPFSRDPVLWRQRLHELREVIRDAPVDPIVQELIREAIVETWGSEDVWVRLRASSNAEHALPLLSSGLYPSVSACLARHTPDEPVNAAHCDSASPGAHTVSSAIRAVWASAYSDAAWQERDDFDIDASSIAMAVLLSPPVGLDDMQVLASTTPLRGPHERIVLNAQRGPWPPVATRAPIRIYAEVDDRGAVVGIERTPSDELEVLSDSDVRRIAETLWWLQRNFPLDELPPEGRSALIYAQWAVPIQGPVTLQTVFPRLY